MEQNNAPKIQVKSILERMKDEASMADIETELLKFFKNNENLYDKKVTKVWASPIGRSVFIISILLAIYTILTMTDYFHIQRLPNSPVKIFDVIAYCAWTILPPAWFMLEYVWLFPPYAKLDSKLLDDLKYTQELAGKIWAGLVVLITAIMWFKYGKAIS